MIDKKMGTNSFRESFDILKQYKSVQMEIKELQSARFQNQKCILNKLSDLLNTILGQFLEESDILYIALTMQYFKREFFMEQILYLGFNYFKI
eukprot:UN20139